MTMEKNYWLGFDLGGTKMMSVVYDGNFQEVGRSRKKTKGHEGADAGLERISTVIQESLNAAQISPEQVGGLGIGCPGPLDLKKGVLKEAPNLGWQNVPIRAHLEKRFGFPVVVGNDVDFGVFGEYSFGAGKGARCVVGLFPGTGIGGGCVYEGKIFRGANCTCMEVGHIPIASGGWPDGAGNLGTLEALASRLVISGAAAQAAYRGQAPYLLKNCGTDLTEIRSTQLADAIKEGDKAIESIVKLAAEYLSIGVVSLIHLLAPDVVVLGGGLVEAMPNLFVNTVSKAVDKRVLPSMRDVAKICEAKLGDEAAVKGAAAAARAELLAPTAPRELLFPAKV